ncbi:MAG: hypothetical protein LBE37_09090, partial [Sphingobacterium sp.]|nr:hypothetical protein [Sphingobacterium sp.]
MYKIVKLTKLAAALSLCQLTHLHPVGAATACVIEVHDLSSRINIHLKTGNAEQALSLLSQYSGYAIGYDKQALQLERIRVNEKSFQNAKFEEVLDYILQHTNIQSKKVNGGVVLTRKEKQQSFTLRIRVTDAQQIPIAGASIKVASDNQTVSTD